MAQKNLLPEGITLTHDSRSLKVLKRLSSGLTGEVYKAKLDDLDVVIKAMKTLDFPMAREFFTKEGETLAYLMRLEEEVKEPLVDGKLKIAPVYYGMNEFKPVGQETAVPCLMMEFIPGLPVPDLLQKQKQFVEIQALTIAWHLYRMLDILHTRLQKTFIDLKFENLWWVEDNSKWGGQLKMTDFGTLEDIKPGDEKRRGVARDTLLGGVYLLAMLTGRTIRYSLGELQERANPIIDEHQSQLTWGVVRLLRRLLHRNPDARPQSVAEVLKEIRTLLNFWGQTSDRLAEMAQLNLAVAEKAAEQARAAQTEMPTDGLDAARRAYSALDILRAKDPARNLDLELERAQAVLSQGDYFERGLALLQGRSFHLSRQTFEQGINWVDSPAFLRRWAYIARIGEEIPPADFEARFEELKLILNALNERQYASAARELEELRTASAGKPGLQSRGLEALISESHLFAALDRAQGLSAAGQNAQAAEAYGEAQQVLKQIPAEFIPLVEDETGSLTLSRLNEETRAAAESATRQFDQAGQALAAGDLEAALNFVRAAAQTDREEILRPEKLLPLARLALQTSSATSARAHEYIHFAAQILWLGRLEMGSEPDFLPLWQAAVNLDQSAAQVSTFDAPQFENLMRAALANLGENRLWAVGLLALGAERALLAQQPEFLRACARLLEELAPQATQPAEWQTRAGEIDSALEETRHAEVDSLLEQVFLALAPILPRGDEPLSLQRAFEVAADQAKSAHSLEIVALRDASARLERAGRLIGKIRPLITRDNYRLEEVESLRQAVLSAAQNASQAVSTQVKARSDQRRQRLQALSFERAELEKEWNWARAVSDPALSQIAAQPLRDKLSNYLYRCYQAAADDREGLESALQRLKVFEQSGQAPADPQDDPAVIEIFIHWAQRALDSLGVEAWQQLAQTASQRVHEIQGEFQNAHNAFAEGNLGLLAAELDRTRAAHGGTPEWQALKRQMAQARAWQAWCEAQKPAFDSGQAAPTLLNDLRAFARLGLPPVYLEKSPVGDFLTLARQNARSSVAQWFKAKQSVHSQEFLDLLNGWLALESTARALQKTSAPALERKIWLAQIYQAAHDRKLNELEKLTASVPALGEEISFNDWDALRRERESAEKASRNAKRVLWATGGIAALCLALVLVGAITYAVNPAGVNQAMFGTYTPTPSLTPSPTLTPTLTPSPTLTLTPTLTPTQIPNSAFLFAANSLYPPAPAQADEVWLIDDPQAVFNPSLATQGQTTWKAVTSEDPKAKGEKFVYTESGSASVAWTMDVPFKTPGLYAVYVLDALTLSAGPQTFSVMLNDQPAAPYRGVNSVIFQSNAQGQTANQWLALGVYRVELGQKMSVAAQLGALTKETPFAADRILILRLGQNASAMLDQLPQGRTLVSLLDDASATFYEVVGKAPVKTRNAGQVFNDLAWNGSLTSRSLVEAYPVPIWVDWTPVGVLPVGAYEVRVWMPQRHATVPCEYQLLLNGKVVARENPAQVNQKDHLNEWWTLGVWQLTEPGAVSVRLVVAPGAVGDIGVDAVAILQVNQP